MGCAFVNMGRGKLVVFATLVAYVAMVVGLYNSRPFFSCEPWSQSMLLCSPEDASTYSMVAVIHYSVRDFVLVLGSSLFALSGFRRGLLKFLWVPASIAVAEGACMATVLYPVINPSISAVTALAALGSVLVALGYLDIVLNLALIPVAIVATPCLATGGFKGFKVVVRKFLGVFAERLVLSFLVVAILRPLIGLGIDYAIASVSPLATFVYLRGFNPYTASILVNAVEHPELFPSGVAPRIPTWGELASLVVATCLCGAMCRRLAKLAGACGRAA